MPTKTARRQSPCKVVHLTSVHPPFDGRIFHKECKSIARAGYDVTLVACHDQDEVIDGVKVRALPRRSGRISRMTKGVWAVYREAIRQKAKLYHFHDPELILVGLLLRLRGKSVVYDVHENVPEDIAFRYYIPRPLRRPISWFVGLLERAASPLFSAIVPATDPISVHFASRNEHVVVVKNYPILNDCQPGITKLWTDRSSSVAYAGVISEDRCIEQMVQAMALLPAEMSATLKLAGAFSPKHLRSEILKIAGWERVEEMGMIPQSSVAKLLDESRAGLVVIRPNPNFVTSAPTKLFEYMYAGIPVIASDFVGFREVVDGARCGFLVNPFDPKAIAEAIEYLLTHPIEAEEMGKRGREAARAKYNWTTEEHKLLGLYDRLSVAIEKS